MTTKPPALDIGVNTYATAAEIDLYLSGRLNSDKFYSFNIANQRRATITASSHISMLVASAYKLGTIGVTVPQKLKDATGELALSMLTDFASIETSTSSKNIKRVKADTVEVEFFAPTNGSRFPPPVMNILKEGGYIASTILASSTSSGTTATSAFDNCDVYNHNRALF